MCRSLYSWVKCSVVQRNSHSQKTKKRVIHHRVVKGPAFLQFCQQRHQIFVHCFDHLFQPFVRFQQVDDADRGQRRAGPVPVRETSTSSLIVFVSQTSNKHRTTNARVTTPKVIQVCCLIFGSVLTVTSRVPGTTNMHHQHLPLPPQPRVLEQVAMDRHVGDVPVANIKKRQKTKVRVFLMG